MIERIKKLKTSQKIILVISGLGLSMLAGYYILSGFPEYAMLQVNKSVERHNWNTFTKFVDIDRILSVAYETEVEIQLREDSLKMAMDGNYKPLFSREFSDLVKHLELEALKEEAEYFVRKGEFENDSLVKYSDRSIAAYKKAFESISNYTGFKKILKTDSVAIFQLSFSSDKKSQGKLTPKELSIRIRFERPGHLWKMTGIENIQELLATLDEIKKEKLH